VSQYFLLRSGDVDLMTDQEQASSDNASYTDHGDVSILHLSTQSLGGIVPEGRIVVNFIDLAPFILQVGIRVLLRPISLFVERWV
jgi:hypothetical protein